MAIEQQPGIRLGNLMRENNQLGKWIPQRKELWKRLGEIRAGRVAEMERIDNIRERTTRSVERRLLLYKRNDLEIDNLFLKAGETRVFLPLPLFESQIVALYGIVTDLPITIPEVQQFLRLERSKDGKRRLAWQHVLRSLSNASDNLYVRINRAQGKFATDPEKEVWGAIREWVQKKQDPNQLLANDFAVLQAFKRKHLPEWFRQRRNNPNLPVLQNKIPAQEPVHMTMQPGQTYVLKVANG